MHDSSLILMRDLLTRFALPAAGKTILDVGSMDVNGTYRPILDELGFGPYTGVDILPGRNVDIVVPDDVIWSEMVSPADLVISGQCLEHVRWPWIWIDNLTLCLKSGGVTIITAPWTWEMHHPPDCWRILPDGMTALLQWAKLEILEVGYKERDCYGVARRP